MVNSIKNRGQVDLINGNIFRSMIAFALPILFSNILQQAYNTVDTVIVGYTLGETSLAAMGACTPVYDLLVGFALGVGNGLSMVAARIFGRGDGNLLKKSAASSLIIGAVISAVVSIVAEISLYPLLRLLSTPEEILAESFGYISVITRFVFVMFAYNLCAGFLQAIGNSLVPLCFLAVAAFLNIGLDLLFILKFSMGVAGAAWATVISQGISVVLCVIYIFRRCRFLVPAKRHFSFDKELFKELAAQGLSMGFMDSIVSIGTLILQPGINRLGTMTIAGHTAARRLFLFSVMPINSMAKTINTFASQNKGAGKQYRVRQAVRYAIRWNLFFAATITAVSIFAAPFFIRLISGSSEATVLQNGSLYFRVVSPFLFILGLVNDTRYALQGLGQKLRPLISSVIELFGKIIFAILLIPRFGYTAVIFCEPIVWCFMAAELLFAFARCPDIRLPRFTEGEKAA